MPNPSALPVLAGLFDADCLLAGTPLKRFFSRFDSPATVTTPRLERTPTGKAGLPARDQRHHMRLAETLDGVVEHPLQFVPIVHPAPTDPAMAERSDAATVIAALIDRSSPSSSRRNDRPRRRRAHSASGREPSRMRPFDACRGGLAGSRPSRHGPSPCPLAPEDLHALRDGR